MSLIRVRSRDLQNPASMILVALDSVTGEPLEELEPIRLQYYPETINYSRGQIGWQEQAIPGLSHGIFGWTGNGSPTLSFEVDFTSDQDPAWAVKSPLQSGKTASHSHVFNVDINAAMAWFVACTNPRYDTDANASSPVNPPPIIQIIPEYIPNDTRARDIAAAFGGRGDSVILDNVAVFEGANPTNFRGVTLSHQTRDFYGVLTSLSEVYESFFVSGAPRTGKVSLTFSETIQLGGVILPHSRTDNAKLAAAYQIRARS